jgi:hypothetical protein
MHNAALSHDGTQVICDYGIYQLTGAELENPESVVPGAASKCKEAYDAGWYQRRRWDEVLTAAADFNSER